MESNELESEITIDAIIRETKLLNAKEVAKILRVSQASVYRLAREGKIRAVRIGGSVRFRVSDLRAYITSNLTGYADDPELEVNVGWESDPADRGRNDPAIKEYFRRKRITSRSREG